MSNIVTLTSSEQLKQRNKEMQEKHQQQQPQQQQPQAAVAAPQQAQGPEMTIFNVKKMIVDEEVVTKLPTISVKGTEIYRVEELKTKKTTTEYVNLGAPGESGDGSNAGAGGK